MPKAFNFFAWVVLVPIHSASTCIKYGGSLCVCSRPAALLLLHAYFKCQAQQRFTSSRLWKVSHKTSTCWGRLCWRFHKSDQWKRITICKLAVIAPRWDENYGLFLYREKKSSYEDCWEFAVKLWPSPIGESAFRPLKKTGFWDSFDAILLAQHLARCTVWLRDMKNIKQQIHCKQGNNTNYISRLSCVTYVVTKLKSSIGLEASWRRIGRR